MPPPRVRNDWDVIPSPLAQNTHNPIREIVENLHLEPNSDKPMIALSIGDPTVFGNLGPPPEAVRAVADALEAGRCHGYAPATGHEAARAAVARYVLPPVAGRDVVLCSGCSGALDMALAALAGPGRHVLVPCPGFPLYRTLLEGLGAVARPYELRPERGWEADLEDLARKMDADCAALVVCNPSNPCGSVMSRAHLRALLRLAAARRVPIIADEVYERMSFARPFNSLAALSRDVPVLACGGLAKRFLAPGWRVGWVIMHDRGDVLERAGVRAALQRLAQRTLGCTSLVQAALPAILGADHSKFFQDTLDTLQRHACAAHAALSVVPGLAPVMPQGAMYMMVGVSLERFPALRSERHFVERLVAEESVFLLPGQCFDYPSYVRLVLTAPEDMLLEACARIAAFCTRYYLLKSCDDTEEEAQARAEA
ncbi:hypothetical protein ANN_18972 [Periplaneta americana]|uniref:Tyrosine aminotransferase n=1 Tax=Periplaneta americana TaxID=6978 RepID=A0ABQ8SRH5_PERAM|nr:hypothetical protein ANN_18972 [Periplaneta americana]